MQVYLYPSCKNQLSQKYFYFCKPVYLRVRIEVLKNSKVVNFVKYVVFTPQKIKNLFFTLNCSSGGLKLNAENRFQN